MSREWQNYLGVALCVIAAGGCTQPAPSQADDRQDADMILLKAQLETLEARVKVAEATAAIPAFDLQSIAYLTPGDEGYSAVSYDIGVLTVQLTDVTEYANGSRVVLRFGNPLSSTVNGLKLKLDWGTVSDQGVPDNENQRSKDFTFIQDLRGGAWTSIPVILEGTPPSKLGFVRVKEVGHTGISLNR